MRSLCSGRSARLTCRQRTPWRASFITAQRCPSTSNATPPPPSSSTAASVSKPVSKLRGFKVDRDAGISADLKGIGVYAGSISAFMRPPQEKKGKDGTSGFKLGDCGGAEPLPCEVPGTPAALQAAQAAHMADAAQAGKLPAAPRRFDAKFTAANPSAAASASSPPSCGHGHSGASHVHHSHASSAPNPKLTAAAPRGPSSLPRRAPPATLNATPAPPPHPRRPPPSLSADTRKGSPPSAPADSASSTISSSGTQVLRSKEASDYYRSLPRNELTKEEMWTRINAANADREEAGNGAAIGSLEVDYLKMEEDLRDFDLFHYRIGEMAYPDPVLRRDYYAMWSLAMSLNKARWSMLEVHSQRGMKTTGAGMKLIFWKESVSAIMEKRRMSAGQFTDSHPVLRPFAAAVERNPAMTKTFVRGFTDARLKVLQQPGNVQQLFDHFDKFYGYFFNSLLEVTHVKDDAAEHLMTHIGRATGLTTHCVMFWKKYARLGFTMLPADICADNHVNLALLKNISLASRDRAVRKVLFDVMCMAKEEMLHAQKVAKDVPPKAWPIVMECLYANYYLGFLQRRDFNVSAMFADHNIENAGYVWYRLKKRWEWERHQSIERLLDEAAPLPFVGTSWGHRGSRYKTVAGIGKDPMQPAARR